MRFHSSRDPIASRRRRQTVAGLSLMLAGVSPLTGAEARSLSRLLPSDPCRVFGPLVFPQPGAHFSCPQFQRLDGTVARVLAMSVGRSLPVTAASAGFVYRFDPETAAFERETAIPGQLFLETTDPVGKGRWNVDLNYQRVHFDEFEGQDLDRLHDTHPPIALTVKSNLFAPQRIPLTIPLFGVDLDTHQWTASTTYGVTDDLDLNLTLPLVYSTLDVSARFGLPALPVGPSTPPCTTATCDLGDSKVGLGDIFLRGKLRLLARAWGQAAAGLVMRIPTGDPNNFEGTGDLEIAPMFYAESARFQVGDLISLKSYFNGGLDLDAEDVGRSEGRWGIGLDVEIAQRATVGVAFLARHAFERLGRAGVFDVPRCARVDGFTCTRLTPRPSPLFGFENERPDFYDLSTGIRINVWGDTVIAFANARVALNDDGVRASVIPLVGLEATF